MTAYSQTCTNSLNFFGSPADVWNAFNWGSFLWGSGTADLSVRVVHLVSNTLSPTEDSIGHAVRKQIANTLAPTEDSIGHAVRHLVTNALAPTEDSIGHAIRHLVTNTLAPTEDTIGHAVRKLIVDSFTLTDAEAEQILHQWADTITVTSTVSGLFIQDSNGYFTYFVPATDNASERVAAGWSADAATTSTWTPASTTSTTWGAA